MRYPLVVALVAIAVPAAASPVAFMGVWAPIGNGIAHPEGGGPVPLTPAAAASVQRAQADAAKGDLRFDPAMHCLPHGTPRMMLAATPMQLLVTPTRVAMVHQWNHSYRLIYLDRGHQPEVDPSFMGDSIGRWAGDALTIDTVNFRAGLLDRTGVPVGEKLTVAERYTLAGHGRRLLGRITVADPDNFTRAWSFRVAFRRVPQGRIAEQICADTDRAGRARIR